MRVLLAWMAVGAMACGTEGGGDRATTIADLTGDVTAGETVYADNCAVCHLEDGTGETNGGQGIDLVQLFIDEPNGDLDFIGTILNGEGAMTPFGDALEDQEIADVMAYMHDAFGG